MSNLSVPTDKGANAGLKVASPVMGMVSGADSIDDMAGHLAERRDLHPASRGDSGRGAELGRLGAMTGAVIDLLLARIPRRERSEEVVVVAEAP